MDDGNKIKDFSLFPQILGSEFYLDCEKAAKVRGCCDM